MPAFGGRQFNFAAAPAAPTAPTLAFGTELASSKCSGCRVEAAVVKEAPPEACGSWRPGRNAGAASGRPDQRSTRESPPSQRSCDRERGVTCRLCLPCYTDEGQKRDCQIEAPGVSARRRLSGSKAKIVQLFPARPRRRWRTTSPACSTSRPPTSSSSPGCCRPRRSRHSDEPGAQHDREETGSVLFAESCSRYWPTGKGQNLSDAWSDTRACSTPLIDLIRVASWTGTWRARSSSWPATCTRHVHAAPGAERHGLPAVIAVVGRWSW